MGEEFFVLKSFPVCMITTRLILDGVQHLPHSCQFMFGQQPNVDIGVAFPFFARAVWVAGSVTPIFYVRYFVPTVCYTDTGLS